MLSSDCHPRSRHWTAIDFAFVLLLSLVHILLWSWANHSAHVWLQVPATDEAHDLSTAWLFHRALESVDPNRLLRTWVSGSSVHTPLIPLGSAMLMRLFGASRIVAQAILPVSILVWIVAVYEIIMRLYDRRTARFATALVTSFPVFLIYSRPYLFEQPWAAVFAVACWFLIASDGFRRRGASLGFGVMAGLTALVRGGGFVILAGPIVVSLFRSDTDSDRARRMLHCAEALAVAITLACTWYAPNSRSFSGYVWQATYGQDAIARTGRAAALSWDAATYYATWLIAQGPGWPMLFVVGAGLFSTAACARARLRPSRTSLALCAVFAINFAVLLIAMQRQTARYFLPMTPILALLIVRIVQNIEPTVVRRGAGVLIALLGLHHIVALSITMPSVDDRVAAPYVRGIPLWDHRTYFKSLVDFYQLRTPVDDFRIEEIVRFLSTLPVQRDAAIAVVGPPHAFFHRNGLQLESIRQQREWRWISELPITDTTEEVIIPDVDVVILRGDEVDFGPRRVSLREVKSFALGDGSIARVLVRTNRSNPEARRP